MIALYTFLSDLIMATVIWSKGYETRDRQESNFFEMDTVVEDVHNAPQLIRTVRYTTILSILEGVVHSMMEVRGSMQADALTGWVFIHAWKTGKYYGCVFETNA